jgi:hypothetical protein
MMDQIEALLIEAGRVLSSANEAALRQCVTALQKVLDQLGGTDTAAKESAVSEARRTLAEADFSYSDRERLVRDAIKAKLRLGMDGYVYLRDCFDDSAVYSVSSMDSADGGLFKVSYAVDDAGTVTLGDPQQVQVVTSYVAVSESGEHLAEAAYDMGTRMAMAKQGRAMDDGSFPIATVADLKNAIQSYGRAADKAKAKAHIIKRAKALKATDQLPADWAGSTNREAALAELELAGDLVPLTEKAVRTDGTTSIKVISPGWGSSGYYGADVLKRDGPAAFPAGTHMYMDHPTAQEEADRPERSLKDLAATFTTAATWKDTGADGPGLYAEAKLRSDLAPLIEELAPSIGVSIRALGKAKQGEAEGRKGAIVESIQSGRSVDFVTLPGRGGRVLDLVESARARHATQDTPLEEVEDMAELEEARTALAEARTALETERAARQRAEERVLLADAARFVEARLAAVQGLPPITRTRLQRQLALTPPVAEGVLDEAAYGASIDAAVAEELAYLAEVGGDRGGAVRGMGGATASGPTADESKAKLAESLGRLGLGKDAALAGANGRN